MSWDVFNCFIRVTEIDSNPKDLHREYVFPVLLIHIMRTGPINTDQRGKISYALVDISISLYRFTHQDDSHIGINHLTSILFEYATSGCVWIWNDDLCVRDRYHAIASHRYCWVYLFAPALDTYFSHTSLHMVLLDSWDILLCKTKGYIVVFLSCHPQILCGDTFHKQFFERNSKLM